MNDIFVKYCCGYDLKDHPCSEIPRKTLKKVDRIIKQKLTADIKKTAAKIACVLKVEILANVSCSTVTQRL